MAILSAKEIYGQKGSFELQQNGAVKRNYSRIWLVTCDRIDEDPIAITFFADIPKLGTFYQKLNTDTLSKVTKVDPQQDKNSPKFWTVEVQYTVLDTGNKNNQPGQQDPQDATDPRNWNTDIAGGNERYTEPMYYDYNGKQLINSANKPFNPPVNVEKDIWRHEFTFFDANLQLSKIYKYSNTLNSKVIWPTLQIPDFPAAGVPIGWAKCMPITYKDVWQDGSRFWQKTVVILVKKGGWFLRPIDRGFDQLFPNPAGGSPDPSKTIPIVDTHGLRPNAPILLNGQGFPLSPQTSTPYVYAQLNGSYTGIATDHLNDVANAQFGYQPLPLMDWWGMPCWAVISQLDTF